MSTKKNPSLTGGNTLDVKYAGQFVGDIKEEFQKISWTEPEQLKTYTKVVVGATFAFGMGIYFLDLAMKGSLSLIETILKIILG